MDNHIIRVENLRRDFQVGGETVHALRGVTFSVAKGEFVTVTEGVPVPQKQPTPERRPMNKYFAALVAAAEALLRAVKGAEGRPNKELKKWTERIEALTSDIMN